MEKIKYFRGLILLFLFLFMGAFVQLFAAKNSGIVVYGTYSVSGGATAGTHITLMENGTQKRKNVRGDGSFKYKLVFNKQYELVFAKDGYITKKVYVSTDVPDRVLKSNNDFPPFEIKITLYKKIKGGDYSIFDEPVAMVIYDKELDDFDFDKAYNVELKEKIKDIEQQIASAPVEVKPDNTTAYNLAIKEADLAFANKDFVQAKQKYQKALDLGVKNSYPKSQIGEIDKLQKSIAQKQEKEALELKINEEYSGLIAKADDSFAGENLDDASAFYEKALELKPRAEYPREQIDKIRGIFADREKAQKNYKKMIAKADRLFRKKKYEDAKVSYAEALEIDKTQEYPQEQIAEIEQLLKQLFEKGKEEELYKENIAKADSLFDNEEWKYAREQYVLASNLNPEKRYPQYKISEIDFKIKEEEEKKRLVAQLKKNPEKEDRTYAQIDLSKVKEQVPIKRDEYEKSVNKGDEAFAKRDWTQARMHYFNALKEKPSHEYLNARIETIDERIADQKSKNERDAQYGKLLKKADDFFKEEKWEEALAGYKKAMEESPKESYPRNQIVRIEKHFQDDLDKQQEKEKNAKFERLLQQAEELYAAKKLSEALEVYEEARELFPANKEVPLKIGAITEVLSKQVLTAEREKEFQKHLQNARKSADENDWIPAIASYKKALFVYDVDSVRLQLEKSREAAMAERKKSIDDFENKQRREYQSIFDKNVANGDYAFSRKNYLSAKIYYEKAESLKPKDLELLDKIRNTLVLLKEQEQEQLKYYKHLDVSNFSKQVRYYKPVKVDRKTKKRYVELQTTDTLFDAKYKGLIKKAEKAMSESNYLFAKSFYQQAYNVKPSPILLVKIQELLEKI